MRAEEGHLRSSLARQADRARLGVDVQAVPRLAFECRHAGAQEFGLELLEIRSQVEVCGGAGGAHGRSDAARRVRGAAHARRELGAALACEDEVGVGVDEAGQHRPPFDVDGRIGCGGVCGLADPGDRGAVDDKRRVGDFAKVVVLRGQQADAAQERAQLAPAFAAAFICCL
jgi:hypothetical protein